MKSVCTRARPQKGPRYGGSSSSPSSDFTLSLLLLEESVVPTVCPPAQIQKKKTSEAGNASPQELIQQDVDLEDQVSGGVWSVRSPAHSLMELCPLSELFRLSMDPPRFSWVVSVDPG